MNLALNALQLQESAEHCVCTTAVTVTRSTLDLNLLICQRLRTQLETTRSGWDTYITQVSKEMVAKDTELLSGGEREAKVKAEIHKCKEDVERWEVTRIIFLLNVKTLILTQVVFLSGISSRCLLVCRGNRLWSRREFSWSWTGNGVARMCVLNITWRVRSSSKAWHRPEIRWANNSICAETVPPLKTLMY